jgi:DNA-binding MarR family transcriptional regulator
MSRSTSRASSPRRAASSPDRTSCHPALNALTGSSIETITLLGRRGPHQIAMTPKELGELANLDARRASRRSRRLSARHLDDALLEPGSAQGG